MASLGGQAANSFSQGLMQGFGYVDQAFTNAENRKQKAEELEQQRRLREEQIIAAQKANSLTSTKMDELEQVKQEANEAKKALRRDKGIQATKLINGFLLDDSSTPSEKSQYVKDVLTKDEALRDVLKVKDPNTFRAMTVDGQDIEEIKKYYAKKGMEITIEEATAIAESGFMAKVDGKVIDLMSLYEIIGGYKVMTPQERRTYQDKIDSFRNTLGIKTPEKEKDTRSTLEKDLTFIEEQMGKGATFDDAWKKYLELKKSSNNGTSSAAVQSAEYYRRLYRESLVRQGIVGKELRDKLATYDEALALNKPGGASTGGKLFEERTANKVKTYGNMLVNNKENGMYQIDQSTMNAETSFKSTYSYQKDKNLQKAEEDTYQTIDTATKIVDLVDKTEKAVQKGARLDILGRFKRNIFNMAPDEAYRWLEDQGLLDTGKLQSELGVDAGTAQIVAELTKMYFGGQASNKDRQVIEDILKSNNTDMLLMKLKNFEEEAVRDANRKADSVIERGIVYTPANKVNSLNRKYTETMQDKQGKQLSTGNRQVVAEQNGNRYLIEIDSSGKYVRTIKEL